MYIIVNVCMYVIVNVCMYVIVNVCMDVCMYVLLPYLSLWVGFVASRPLRELQGASLQVNSRGRSLQDPRSAATSWLTNTTLSSGVSLIYLWQFTFRLQVKLL